MGDILESDLSYDSAAILTGHIKRTIDGSNDELQFYI